MRALTLTYHSLNGGSQLYGSDDHTSLADDLRTLAEHDFAFTSLRRLAEHIRFGVNPELDQGHWVALSFDDGAAYDCKDYIAADGTIIRSFHSIVTDFNHDAMRRASATSFVIVSAAARRQLDTRLLGGHGNWGDDWWDGVASEGVIDIENHSWDHNHQDATDDDAPNAVSRGNFRSIAQQSDADFQIRAAELALRSRLSRNRPGLFAYPYGEYNDYLTEEYFPKHANLFLAAFSTDPDYTHRASPLWALPRFVCGDHWKSRADFLSILKGCSG